MRLQGAASDGLRKGKRSRKVFHQTSSRVNNEKSWSLLDELSCIFPFRISWYFFARFFQWFFSFFISIEVLWRTNSICRFHVLRNLGSRKKFVVQQKHLQLASNKNVADFLLLCCTLMFLTCLARISNLVIYFSVKRNFREAKVVATLQHSRLPEWTNERAPYFAVPFIPLWYLKDEKTRKEKYNKTI